MLYLWSVFILSVLPLVWSVIYVETLNIAAACTLLNTRDYVLCLDYLGRTRTVEIN